MRNVCILIQWISGGRLCLKSCRHGLCSKIKSKS
jgi:hypothetical protein